MKKTLVIVLAVFLLMTGGCGRPRNQKHGTLMELTAQETIDKFENKETFIFFVSQTTCQHCGLYRSYLEEYMRTHELTVYFVQADAEINADTFRTLHKEYVPDCDSTPTTYYVENGEVKDRVVGEMEPDAIKVWLTRLEIELPN